MTRILTNIGLMFLCTALVHGGQTIAPGSVTDAVTCSDDPSQTYALYLPSTFSADRPSPLLLGFHPGARGRAIVDTYQAAAERYGYIVAASNNSRNGPWAVSARAITAMTADLARRFPIAAGRFYATGLSGGARVAMQLAMATGKINGVIASSAGFPDSQPRRSVPFAIFGTAGTEDFNYVEMKLMSQALKTPHRVVIFEGGHQLPPAPVALDAVEWLELQAMRTGSRARDAALINALFDRRLAAADALAQPAAATEALQAIVTDFEGLRDVSAISSRVTSLLADPATKRAIKRGHDDDVAEARLLNEVIELEAGLTDETQRSQNLLRLRGTLTRMFKQATATADSPERQQARRVLRAITASAGDRVQDPEYRALLDSVRLPGGGRGR